MKRFIIIFLTLILLLFASGITYILVSSRIEDPNYHLEGLDTTLTELNDGFRKTTGAWLKQNEEGIYELYVEGSALELGHRRGIVSRHLIEHQERLFLEKIQEIIPSENYLMILKDLVAWFNRNLPDYIDESLKKELFAISRFASDEFDFVGSKYQRILNYHAAHDIGHALENYALVGCTSFGSWKGDSTAMVIGRNFDFSMGEEFAKNKVVCFYNPDDGIPFAMISWSDFVGCVSGMNMKGLTVTLNAGENDVPENTGTPISLIAREILQHASNIDEAYSIARSRKSFVSESILIGSAADHKTAIIEKTPDTTLLVLPDKKELICTNHFQSSSLAKNKDAQFLSSSPYRYERMQELLKDQVIDPSIAVSILRDRNGIDSKDIGMGNEKAINQLVAHHGIVFQPDSLKFWISAGPFQLGAFLCYDLEKVIGQGASIDRNHPIHESEESIEADSFLTSEQFKSFRKWQSISDNIEDGVNQDLDVQAFINLNPQHYRTYELIGGHYEGLRKMDSTKKYLELALLKEIPYLSQKRSIEERLNSIPE